MVAVITQQKNTLSGSLEIYDGDGQAIVRKHTSYPAWDCATLISGMAILIQGPEEEKAGEAARSLRSSLSRLRPSGGRHAQS